MRHIDPDTAISLGFYAWLCLALAIGFAGLRHDGKRVSYDGATAKFCGPVSARLGFGMIGILLVIITPAFHWLDAVDAARNHLPPPDDFALLVFGYTIWGSFGVFLLSLSVSPNFLFLNLQQRMYRYASPWPPFSRPEIGSFEDMAGVFMKRSPRGAGWRVGIAWRQEKSNNPVLGFFGTEKEAEAAADEMAARFGLSRVMPPPVGQTSVDPTWAVLHQETALPPFRPFRSTLFPAEEAGSETR
jgi:hypothetical protein